MILPWLIYWILAAVLFAIAAGAIEVPVRQRGWPVRGLWAGAMVASVSLPLLQSMLSALGEPGGSQSSPSADPGMGFLAGPEARVDPLVPWLAGLRLDPPLIALWIASSVAMASYLVLVARSLRRRGRGWTPATVEGREVWRSRDFGPAVVGFLQPRIVMPEWIIDRAEPARLLAISHEEQHVRARDPQLALAGLLLIVLFPWNPGLWWSWRRLRHAIEVDCDLRVVGQGFSPRAYARLLMEVGERRAHRQLAVAAFSGSHSLLERRIRFMATAKPRNWRWRAAASAVLATGSALAACQMDRPAAPDALAPSLAQAPDTRPGAGRGVLSGRVLDPHGKPAAGAKVVVVRSTRGAITRADGRFVLTSVPEGDQIVRIELEGVGYSSRAVTIVPDREVPLEVRLAPWPADFTGIPIGPSTAPRVLRSGTDSLAFSGIPATPGNVLTVRANDDGTWSVNEAPPTGGRIMVTAVDLSGAARPGVSVKSGTRSATTGADGRAMLFDLAPGKHELHIGADGRTIEMVVEVVEGLTAPARVQL